MPFIEDKRETGRRIFSNSDWIRFLPGGCGLARKVLPYLVELHRQLLVDGRVLVITPTCAAGVEDYDEYMSIQAVLVVMMASSINGDDGRWLEDRGVIDILRGLECGRWMPYGRPEDHGWRERCAMVRAGLMRITVGVVGSTWSGDTSGFMRGAFVFVGGGDAASAGRIGSMVDGCGVQMLRDIFYVVTGRRIHGRERSEGSVVDSIPVGRNEVVSWCTDCPTGDSGDCRVGACEHLTGVLPIIGVALPVCDGRDGG